MGFLLSGIFSVRLLRRFISSAPIRIAYAMLFVLCPIALYRVFLHTSLGGGQWLILAALDLYLEDAKRDRTRRNEAYLRVMWALMAVLSISIHIYFTLMVGLLLLSSCLDHLVRTRSFRRPFGCLFWFLFWGLGTAGVLGAFNSSMRAEDGGLGEFSMNLLSLFNPRGWSCLLKDLPNESDQMEGFLYLGLGVLVLCVLSLAGILTSSKVRSLYRAHRSQILWLFFCGLVCAALAISPEVHLGDLTLFTIPISDSIHSLWSIFRASGRIGWVVVYLVMFWAMVGTDRFLQDHRAVSLAAAFLVTALQIFDIHEPLQERHASFQAGAWEKDELTEGFWDQLLKEDSDLQHVVFTTGFDRFYSCHCWAVAEWALDNHLSLDSFYFARYYDGFDYLINNVYKTPDTTMVYLYRPDEAEADGAFDKGLALYAIDNMVVGTMVPVDGYESYEITSPEEIPEMQQ